jgi:glycosyltransferase involved in cell wall biosynthesis
VYGIGGAEQLLGALVEEGDRRSCDQLVLNPFANDPAATLEQLIGHRRYARPPSNGTVKALATRRWVHDELEAFRPEVVHVLLFRAVVTVASLPRRRDHTRVQTHAYGEGVRLPPYGKLKERLDRWAGRRYDHAIAISMAGRRLLVEEYGYPSAHVTYIPPGWDGDPWARSPPSEPTVICVAKLRAEKGHEILLDALALVRRRVPDVRLVLVGDGERRAALEARAAALGLRDCVDFAGAVPEVWPYLARAHVFALASRSEAFGIAAVEALAAGLPVVGPATGGLLDLVQPGVTGQLFPPGDHRALAEALIQLLSESTVRERMSEAAREAADPFRRRATLERYFELFSELAERARAAGRRSRSGS